MTSLWRRLFYRTPAIAPEAPSGVSPPDTGSELFDPTVVGLCQFACRAMLQRPLSENATEFEAKAGSHYLKSEAYNEYHTSMQGVLNNLKQKHDFTEVALTHRSAMLRYGVFQSDDRLIVAIASPQPNARVSDDSVKPRSLVDVPQLGRVHSELVRLASNLPVVTLLALCTPPPAEGDQASSSSSSGRPKQRTLIFTGHSRAGEVAHMAAVLARSQLEGRDIPIKAVSFGGLCLARFDPSLELQSENHLTLLSQSNGFDLAASILAHLPNGPSPSAPADPASEMSASESAAEDRLTDLLRDANASALSEIEGKEAVLECWGRAFYQAAAVGKFVVETTSEDTARQWESCTAERLSEWFQTSARIVPSQSLDILLNCAISPSTPFPATRPDCGRLMALFPALKQVTLLQVTGDPRHHHRVDFVLDGSGLEALLGRDRTSPCQHLLDLPASGYKRSPGSTMVPRVPTNPIQARVIVTDCEWVRRSSVSIFTDFGPSNFLKAACPSQCTLPDASLTPYSLMNTQFMKAMVDRALSLHVLATSQGNTALFNQFNNYLTVLISLEQLLTTERSFSIQSLVESNLKNLSDVIEIQPRVFKVAKELSNAICDQLEFKTQERCPSKLSRGFWAFASNMGDYFSWWFQPRQPISDVHHHHHHHHYHHHHGRHHHDDDPDAAAVAMVLVTLMLVFVAAGVVISLGRLAFEGIPEGQVLDVMSTQYMTTLCFLIMFLGGNPGHSSVATILGLERTLCDLYQSRFGVPLSAETETRIFGNVSTVQPTGVPPFPSLMVEAQQRIARLCLAVGQISLARQLVAADLIVSFCGTHQAGISTLHDKLFPESAMARSHPLSEAHLHRVHSSRTAAASSSSSSQEASSQPASSTCTEQVGSLEFSVEMLPPEPKVTVTLDDLQSTLTVCDFPGVQQGGVASTEYLIGMSSFVVCVFRVHNVGAAELELVDVIRRELGTTGGQGLLVVITHCDTVPDWSEATRATLSAEYAAQLQVYQHQIEFVDASTEVDVERVRLVLLRRVKERFPGQLPIANNLFGVHHDDDDLT